MRHKADEAERLREELQRRLAAYQNRNPVDLARRFQRVSTQIVGAQADLDALLQGRQAAEEKARLREAQRANNKKS